MSAQHQPPAEDAKVAPVTNQTAGNGIRERIAEVVGAHYPCPCGRNEFGYPHCVCGWNEPIEGLLWRDHVALVLVAELGLREVQTTGKLVGGTLHIVYDGSASKHRYYMTPWEPA